MTNWYYYRYRSAGDQRGGTKDRPDIGAVATNRRAGSGQRWCNDYRTFDFTNSGESVFGSSSSYAILSDVNPLRPERVSSSSDNAASRFARFPIPSHLLPVMPVADAVNPVRLAKLCRGDSPARCQGKVLPSGRRFNTPPTWRAARGDTTVRTSP